MTNERILFLCPSIGVGGGTERFTALLGNELLEKGYNVCCLPFFDEKVTYDFKGKLLSFGYKNRSKKTFNRIYGVLKRSAEIKKFCDDKRISTIISVGEIANYHAYFSKLFFKNNAKLIFTQHIHPDPNFYDKVSYNLIKFTYSKSDIVVCVSKGIEHTLKKYYNLKNTKTIYNFWDTKQISRWSNLDLPIKYDGIYNSKFIFINIGRLSQQKGQFFLIRSFKKVVDFYKDIKLVILGEGELNDDLNSLVKNLDLSDNVFLLGNQKNIFPFLKNSNCFIMSSLYEGLPLTLIEALSVNIATISTDCKTGPREILCPELDLEKPINYPYFGEYGILTMPFEKKLILRTIEEKSLSNAEKILAEAMINIIEDSDLRNRYSNGLDVIKTRFDKDVILQEWINLI